MGFIQAIDQALAKSLMVEFLRLKLITGDDLSTTLRTWHADMDAATEEFLRDLDSATQTSTALPSKNAAVEVALHKYQEVAKLKLALLLTQLNAAREEMEKFIQFCLEELQSQQEMKNLVTELSSRITDHRGKVCQLLRSEPLRHAEVALLILVGMAADWPLKSNFFPGLLEGLLGRLGIAVPGESKPPTSSREGAGRLWSSAVHEAISQLEQREVETPGSAELPQCLDLHKVPSISSQLEDGGPKPEVLEPKESTPSTSKSSQQAQEQVTKASNTDSDKTDEPTPEKEQPPRGLKVKISHKLRKHGSKAATSSSKDGATPSKVQKESEAVDAQPAASTGPSEAALQTAQFKLYGKDLPEVKKVCARILSLEEGEEATQEDFDSSPDF